jgi:hypothetical protein
MSTYPLLHPLEFGQGTTWKFNARWMQSDGVNPVDLTGYTARMQLRERYGAPSAAITLTTENTRITLGGVLGTIVFLVAATDTSPVGAAEYVYDLELVSGGGEVTRLIYGPCVVSAEATKTTT